jgi:hypothetical protein
LACLASEQAENQIKHVSYGKTVPTNEEKLYKTEKLNHLS